MGQKFITKAERKRMFDEYLNDTGANFIEFVEFRRWLKRRPKHPFHARMFRSDKDHIDSDQKRIFRQLTQGLTQRVIIQHTPNVERVEVVPVFTAIPSTDRSEYTAFDVTDEDQRVLELSRGLAALRGWHKRYAGIANAHGIPVDSDVGAAIARMETALAG